MKSEKDRLYVATKLLDSVLLVANHSEGDLAHDGASSNDPDLERFEYYQYRCELVGKAESPDIVEER